jgi:hypothetical protein
MTKLNSTLIIACILLACMEVITFRTCQAEHENKVISEANWQAIHDTVKYWRDKSGIENAVIESQEGEIKDLKGEMVNILDSTSKRLQIARKSIEGYQKVIAHLNDSKQLPIQYMNPDTSIFISNNKYSSDTGIIIHDTIVILKEHDIVPITLTEYKRGNNHYINANSDNPKVRLTGLNSALIIKEKPKTVQVMTGVVAGIVAGLFLHTIIR